jgi:hypothetical protein
MEKISRGNKPIQKQPELEVKEVMVEKQDDMRSGVSSKETALLLKNKEKNRI